MLHIQTNKIFMMYYMYIVHHKNLVRLKLQKREIDIIKGTEVD